MKKFSAKFHNLPFLLQKFFCILFLLILFGPLYIIIGRFPLHPPKQLPLTELDNMVPLLNWSFWAYAGGFLLIPLIILIMPDHQSLYRFRKALLATVFFHFAFFIVYPVAYPRPTIQGVELVEKIARTIHLVDSNNNCFPSLLTALTVLAMSVSMKTSKFLRFPIFLWGMASLASLLTTKQHYLYGILGGILVAIFVFIIYYRKPIPITPQT